MKPLNLPLVSADGMARDQASRSRSRNRPWIALTALMVALMAALPAVLETYAITNVRDALIFSLLAVALDFLWGKTGILSFGHAAFFGAGAYGVGVVATRLGLDPSIGPWLGLLAGIAIAMVVSLLVGYFLIFGGVRGPYFTIVTLALAVITDHIVVGWSEVTGGNAGLIGIPPLLFPQAGGAGRLSDAGQYWLILAVVTAVTLALWLTCRRRYGQILQAIQDNELRARALGHNTSAHLLVVFVASAAIAALAGGLYGATVGFVAPDVVGLILSTQAVVWVAVGGRSTLIGPILATVLVIWLEQRVSSIDTSLWPLIIGALFIVSVFAFPDGILGRVRQWLARHDVDRGSEQ